MADLNWRCCGCGAVWGGNKKECDCPTDVLYQRGSDDTVLKSDVLRGDVRLEICSTADETPVTVQVELSDLEKILGIWEEVAEDLKCSVDAEYAHRSGRPSEARKHKRDVEPAVLSLSMIPALRLKYSVEKFER